MNVENVINLPVCDTAIEDPTRLHLKRSLKHAGMRFAGRLAAWQMSRPITTSHNQFGILVYHRVSPEVEGLPAPYYNVPPDSFYDQLSGLQELGFTFLALRDVLQRRARGEVLPPRTVVVTFDDGYHSVYEHALPILRSLGIPATVFVCTAYLGEATPFPFDAWGQAYAGKIPIESYRPMSFAECADSLSIGSIEIGAHSHMHADFRGRPAIFRRDMVKCLDKLRSELGITDPTFAFPYGCPRLGHAGADLVEVIRQLGLPASLTTAARCVNLSDSPHQWARFNAYDWDSTETLAAKLTGYYSWVPRAAEWLADVWRWRPRTMRRSPPDMEARANA